MPKAARNPERSACMPALPEVIRVPSMSQRSRIALDKEVRSSEEREWLANKNYSTWDRGKVSGSHGVVVQRARVSFKGGLSGGGVSSGSASGFPGVGGGSPQGRTWLLLGLGRNRELRLRPRANALIFRNRLFKHTVSGPTRAAGMVDANPRLDGS